MNLFDAQLLLRPRALARQASRTGPSPLTVREVLGHTLPMARMSFVVLPCEVADEKGAVRAALRWVQALRLSLGTRVVEVSVEVVANLTRGLAGHDRVADLAASSHTNIFVFTPSLS